MATRVQDARKTPQQQRSRATVDVIVTAAARVLARAGWRGFTTNAVAAAGGISVGSIYQYFPDKLALLEAVRLRHHVQVLDVLKRAAAAPPPDRIQRLVDGLIEAHSPEPGLHHVLLNDCPQSPAHADAAFHEAYLDLYASLFPVCAGRDRRLEASILAAALAGAVHEVAGSALEREPPWRQELVRLARAYIEADR